MTAKPSNTAAEREIRKIMDDSVAAIRARDIEGSLAHHAPAVLSFDVVNPLQYQGLDAVRERLEEWFSAFTGSIGFEMDELSVTASDDVAFCHSLNHVSATTTQGGTLDMWWRASKGLRKIEGRWLVTHEHSSVPFDVGSGKASLDLKP